MGLFSGIFGGGKKTTKTDQTNKSHLTASNQSQQQQTNLQNKSANINSAGATTNQQVGTTGAQQASQQQQTGNVSGSQQQTQQAFSGDILAGLTSLISGGQGGAALGLDQLGLLSQQASANSNGFNVQSFVDSQLAAGQQQFADNVLPSLRAFDSTIGGTSQTNSMSNLLAQQAFGRQQVNQGTIANQAAAAGNQIQNQNLGTAVNSAQALSQSLVPLLQVLKGGQVTSAGQTSQATQQSQQGSQASTGQTSQASAGTTQKKQTTQELLQAFADAIASSNAKQDSLTSVKGTNVTTQTPSLFGALGQIANLGAAIYGINK